MKTISLLVSAPDVLGLLNEPLVKAPCLPTRNERRENDIDP